MTLKRILRNRHSQQFIFSSGIGGLGSSLMSVVILLCVLTPLFADTTGTLIKETYNGHRLRAISLKGCGGQENWSSLTVMPDGKALVGMSSRKKSAVLITVDPTTEKTQMVMDLAQVGRLATLERQPKIHVTPTLGVDGQYHFVSHFGLDTHLPLHGSRIGYQGMHHWRWDPVTGRGEDLGLILAGEGAVAQMVTSDGKRLFVITFPQGFLLEINTHHNTVHNYGRTNGVYPPRYILKDPQDRPYVLDHEGRFWRVDIDGDELEPLEIYLPVDNSVSGNHLAQGFVSVIASPDCRTYHAMSAWGRLYELNYDDEHAWRITDRGNPADAIETPRWRPVGQRAGTAAGLAYGPDGWIYIAYSGYNKTLDPNGDCYIIRSQRDGSRSQLVGSFSGSIVSYLCGCNAFDPGMNRIYFAASHLIKDNPYLLVVEIPKGK